MMMSPFGERSPGVLAGPKVVLRGLAQLVFAERAPAGALVLAGIWLLAPWAALGGLFGAAFGTLAGGWAAHYTRAEWRAGLAGFNGAIIGVLWGGFPAAGNWNLPVLGAALGLCVLLEWALKRLLGRFSLPVLSMPAVVAAISISLLLAPPGTWYWIDAPASLFGTPGLLAAIACLVVAMAIKHPGATVQALLAGVLAVLAAVHWLDLGPSESIGLWAFTVVPASFAIQAVFVRGAMAGFAAGLMAAVLGAAIWILWYALGGAERVPPLLAPFILGVWGVLAVSRRLRSSCWLQPDLWRLAWALSNTHDGRRPAVVLVAGSLAVDAGLVDFASGSWRDPQVPSSVYTARRFRASAHCRRAWWDACDGLYRQALKARPAPAHRALGALGRHVRVSGVITQCVDGLLQTSGIGQLVELGGRLGSVRCSDCGHGAGWPPARVWRHRDIHCPRCRGLLKPTVVMPSEPPLTAAWSAASRLAGGAGVFLVLGIANRTDESARLIERARVAGARICHVTEGMLSPPLAPKDLVIRGAVGAVLVAIVALCGCARAVGIAGAHRAPAIP